MGDYGHRSHGTRPEGSRFGGKRHREGLGVIYAPYQIPFGTIVAKDVRNLLAPVPASASIRMWVFARCGWNRSGVHWARRPGMRRAWALQQRATPDVRTVNVSKLQTWPRFEAGAQGGRRWDARGLDPCGVQGVAIRRLEVWTPFKRRRLLTLIDGNDFRGLRPDWIQPVWPGEPGTRRT
ncbi:MAG: hypothetical protein ACREH8_19020 [Opitutaceae bacterium]